MDRGSIGITYKFQGPNGFSSTSKDISGLLAGLYHVTVTAAGGCYVEADSRVGPDRPERDAPYPIYGRNTNLRGVRTVGYTATAFDGVTGFNWIIPAGFTLISGQGTVTVTIKTPATFTTALLQVSATSDCGTTGVRSLELKGGPGDLINVEITGPGQVVAGSTNVYNIQSIPNLSYVWTADGGSVVGGWGTTSASIKAGAISGYVKATLKNACGSAPVVPKFVTVQPAALYSVATNSQLEVLESSFRAYPNPIRDLATVEFTAPKKDEKYELRVVDLYGQILFAKRGQTVSGVNTVQLTLGRHTKGIYIVNLITAEKTRSIKLLKGN